MGFSAGPSHLQDGGDEDLVIEISVVDLKDEAPPLPRPFRGNVSTSHVPSGIGATYRSTRPISSGPAGQANPLKDQMSTKKRASH